MKRCPITYELCEENMPYSQKGLSFLQKNLKQLNPFPYTLKEQLLLAAQTATKLSIQGVQPKLSVKLNAKKEVFEIVEKQGSFILKPPHHMYEEVPQNEDLSMKLAQTIGLKVPLHGMIYNIDGSLSYFIKRFDRKGREKIGVEDFSQLLQANRDTKYDSSMEKIVNVIEKHCSFPSTEKLKLFRLMLFNFLIGNEDMHLKNFSLIRSAHQVELTPVYDLLNTTILMQAKEQIALPIKGKKNNLKREDFIDYFFLERLKLPLEVAKKELKNFQSHFQEWDNLIDQSFLSEKMKFKYKQLLTERKQILALY